MYQKERMDAIMKIVKENHYVTVEYLVKEIKYSPASIRRDLTILQKQGLVTRSYGGITYKDANISPFRFRQHSMKKEKNAIAQKAAALVQSGDVIYIDGSSTAQYMGHFLTEKKDITVVTSNMMLADYLSEHGISIYCTGGKIVERPGILGGDFMLDTIKKFNFDIAFFSSHAFNSNGQVCSHVESGVHYHQELRKHTKKLVYLCGSDKFDAEGKYVSLTLKDLNCVISDKEISAEIKKAYPETSYICTENNE